LSFALISNLRILIFLLFLLSLKLNGQECNSNALINSSPQENTSWAISADFLYWLASEEVSSIYADVITVGDNTSSWEALSFDFNWDYGFRIGAGSCFSCDRWDTSFYWTRFLQLQSILFFLLLILELPLNFLLPF
jgi:hypothetical protein